MAKDKMAPCSMSETVLQVAQKDASYTVVPRINPGKCPAAFD
jgi:hypothetical protein